MGKPLVYGLGVVAVGLGLWISSLDPSIRGGLRPVFSQGDFDNLMEDGSRITTPIFTKADGGEELTEADRETLRQQAVLIDSANRYGPQHVSGYLGSGTCYLLLGEPEKALPRLQQAAFNLQNDKDREALESKGEVPYRLSQTELALHQPEAALAQAKLAEAVQPHSPEYLTAEAAALVALRRGSVAADRLRTALALDPTLVPALRLNQNLHAGGR